MAVVGRNRDKPRSLCRQCTPVRMAASYDGVDVSHLALGVIRRTRLGARKAWLRGCCYCAKRKPEAGSACPPDRKLTRLAPHSLTKRSLGCRAPAEVLSSCSTKISRSRSGNCVGIALLGENHYRVQSPTRNVLSGGGNSDEMDVRFVAARAAARSRRERARDSEDLRPRARGVGAGVRRCTCGACVGAAAASSRAGWLSNPIVRDSEHANDRDLARGTDPAQNSGSELYSALCPAWRVRSRHNHSNTSTEEPDQTVKFVLRVCAKCSDLGGGPAAGQRARVKARRLGAQFFPRSCEAAQSEIDSGLAAHDIQSAVQKRRASHGRARKLSAEGEKRAVCTESTVTGAFERSRPLLALEREIKRAQISLMVRIRKRHGCAAGEATESEQEGMEEGASALKRKEPTTTSAAKAGNVGLHLATINPSCSSNRYVPVIAFFVLVASWRIVALETPAGRATRAPRVLWICGGAAGDGSTESGACFRRHAGASSPILVGTTSLAS